MVTRLKKDECCLCQVTFLFKFKRKPDFYGLNMILPVLLLAVMAVFVFMLPAESGEKIGFSLTVLLAFVVLMTLLGDKMPSTADHTSLFGEAMIRKRVWVLWQVHSSICSRKLIIIMTTGRCKIWRQILSLGSYTALSLCEVFIISLSLSVPLCLSVSVSVSVCLSTVMNLRR